MSVGFISPGYGTARVVPLGGPLSWLAFRLTINFKGGTVIEGKLFYFRNAYRNYHSAKGSASVKRTLSD
jgi:hypothetical protein